MKKAIVLTVATAFGVAAAGMAHAQAKAEDLLKSNGCLNCHAVGEKKAGPALKEIAAKNKGKADAEKTLVAKLKEGKGHPAAKASDADLTAMVKFVLAQ
jgi:cytochrome c